MGFLSDVLPFFFAPGARHANDLSAFEGGLWDGAGLPPGLVVQWLGTAGVRVSYEGVTVLIDPFVSRRSLPDVLRARPFPSDPTLVARHLPRADAILVGHAHFDHALDVPTVAARDRCPVYGSESMAAAMGLFGLRPLAVVVEPRRPFVVGPFRVTFIPSVHSKLILGFATPSAGEITCAHTEHLTSRAWRCGRVFGLRIEVAGISLYHQGSADLLDEEITERVDIFLAGIAGRGFTKDYAGRILGRLQPRLIVPNHFDDFFRPVDTPMGFSFNVNYGAFLDEVRAVSSDFEVRALRPLQAVGGVG